MRVVEFSRLEDLAPHAEAWDRLAAGVPFRCWDWMSTWWRCYGSPGGRSHLRLAVLGVLEPGDRLVGLAPWFLDRRWQARALRWLGFGEVCSDYLSLLCQPGLEESVAEALAEYLTAGEDMHPRLAAFRLPPTAHRRASPAAKLPLRWDVLVIEGVDAQDRPTGELVRRLADRGCLVHSRPGMNCWRIDLPPTWEQYLATLSKSHRKQIRRLERSVLEPGRAVLHAVERLDQLPEAIEVLIALHQRRRRWLGQGGCFASPRFTAFHSEVMPKLLSAGHLRLSWLELDGRPAAAEYQLAGNGVLYAYQGGVDPDVLQEEPGRLIMQATLRRAVEEGCRALDFLRGDEPYKAHFRASPRPGLALRIIPNRTLARWRQQCWAAGRAMKHWMQSRKRRTLESPGCNPGALSHQFPIPNLPPPCPSGEPCC
jgi:CelD/BcsL family acetyltransferase involved in cellulose biosynthesis